MSRWIDAEWLLRFFEPFSDNYHTPLGVLRACIDDAPSIDIVRCKECKKLTDCTNDDWQREVIESGYIGWCNRTSRLGAVTYVKADDFCSYGERSE